MDRPELQSVNILFRFFCFAGVVLRHAEGKDAEMSELHLGNWATGAADLL